MLLRLHEQGQLCNYMHADIAGKHGHMQVVRCLESLGVLRSRAVLLELYEAVMSDENWWRRLNVDDNDDGDGASSWFGAQCNRSGEVCMIVLNRFDYDLQLTMRRRDEGPPAYIPASLGSLTTLIAVIITANNLQGVLGKL